MDPLSGCGQSPPFSPRDDCVDSVASWSAKGYASVFPARLPTVPDGQTAPQTALPRDNPKSGAPTLKRFCPAGANSVAPAHRQRPLPLRGKAAPFNPPSTPSTAPTEPNRSTPAPARGAGVRIRRCSPLRGEGASELARLILVCRGERAFAERSVLQELFGRRAGKRKTGRRRPIRGVFPRMSLRLSHIQSRSSRAALSPCLPAGRPAGSARTRSRVQTLENPFLGNSLRFPAAPRPPKTPQAAGPCSWACRRVCALPPEQKRNEAPKPPARGAWARLHGSIQNSV